MNEYIVRCLILLFKIMLLIMSPLTFAENLPGFVCGKFNGHVMEVPDSYIIYWAEYEGASAWDPDFINNKKGCDANFVVQPMIASWPDMQPGDQELWYKQGLEYEGLRMRVEPYIRSDTDVAFMRDAYLRLRKYENKTFDPVVYIDKLGLFFVKTTRKLFRAEPQDRNSPYWFDEDVNGYYWAEVNGRAPVVFDCQ
ncbi:hypothetical protein PGS49_07075, partial [Yersinia intermedia]|uniref:hypothetical protein n=1 Tax=Yersinia intermedia TaxID=631 RepID=UPI0022FE7E97